MKGRGSKLHQNCSSNIILTHNKQNCQLPNRKI